LDKIIRDNLTINLDSLRVYIDDVLVRDMTSRMAQYLGLLASRPEKVWKYIEIYEAVFGRALADMETLKYMNKVIRKHLLRTPWTIKNVYGLGYRFERKGY